MFTAAPFSFLPKFFEAIMSGNQSSCLSLDVQLLSCCCCFCMLYFIIHGLQLDLYMKEMIDITLKISLIFFVNRMP